MQALAAIGAELNRSDLIPASTLVWPDRPCLLTQVLLFIATMVPIPWQIQRDEQAMAQRLRWRTIAGSTASIFAIATTVAAASVWPLYQQLRHNQTQNLIHTAQVQALAIEQWQQRATDIAWQITSRTRIREALNDYNRGKLTRDELTAFSESKLADALQTSDAAIALVRYDANGEPVARVNAGFERAIAPLVRRGDRRLRSRLLWQAGTPYLAVSAPILDPVAAQLLGRDVVIFDAASLKALLEQATPGETGSALLLVPGASQPLAAEASGETLSTALSKAIAGADLTAAQVAIERVSSERVLATASVGDSGWRLAIAQHPRELYASLRGNLLSLGALIVALGSLQTAGIVLLLRPLADRVLLRSERLEQLVRRLQAACEESPVSIAIANTAGNIEYVNPKFEATSGYSAAEAIGRNPRFLQSGRTPREVYERLWATLGAGQTWTGQLQNRRKNGELYWESISISPVKDDRGAIAHYVAIKEDLSECRDTEAQLTYQAQHDPLTGLLNRTAGLYQLEQAIASARQQQSAVQLLFINLDRFHAINDRFGHQAGDRCLQAVSQRLQTCLQSKEQLVRFGGDEFIAILPAGSTRHRALSLAQVMLTALATSHPLPVKGSQISASIGVATYPDDGDDADALVQQADAAMYVAKRQGRNAVQVSAADLQAALRERVQLEMGLHWALERDEIAAAYQPLVELASGRIVGAEVLMRWHSAELGTVSPDQFIPIAEETGAIASLSQALLTRACADLASWSAASDRPLRLAVNLSPRQFQEPDLADRILATLAARDLAPDRLEIEVVERSGLDAIPQAAAIIDRLHQAGTRLAIDDFGTGYASLSYLKQYPFATLKIDRSFVSALPDDQEMVLLVEAMLAMARAIGLETVAEGIETAAQAECLTAAGCHYGQGYFLSPPLPAAEFQDLLACRQPLRAC